MNPKWQNEDKSCSLIQSACPSDFNPSSLEQLPELEKGCMCVGKKREGDHDHDVAAELSYSLCATVGTFGPKRLPLSQLDPSSVTECLNRSPDSPSSQVNETVSHGEQIVFYLSFRGKLSLVAVLIIVVEKYIYL